VTEQASQALGENAIEIRKHRSFRTRVNPGTSTVGGVTDQTVNTNLPYSANFTESQKTRHTTGVLVKFEVTRMDDNADWRVNRNGEAVCDRSAYYE
jgi:hypothetical protein